MGLPIIFAVYALIKQITPSFEYIEAGILIITCYPFFNALVTIIFVAPYYNFTKQWISKLGCCGCDQKQTKTAVVLPATTIIDQK